MSEVDLETLRRLSAPAGWRRRLFAEGLLACRRGRLYVEGPGRQRMMFGPPLSLPLAPMPAGLAVEATVVIEGEGFFEACLRDGFEGLELSYADGLWKTSDLRAVLAWFLRNRTTDCLLAAAWRPRGFADRLRWTVLRFRPASRPPGTRGPDLWQQRLGEYRSTLTEVERLLGL